MVEPVNEYKITKLIQKTKRFFVLFSIIILPFCTSLAQAPTWITGTPIISNVGPTTVTVDFGINKVGVIYIVVYNANVVGLASGDVRSAALLGPSGARVATAVITVTSGNINTVLQQILGILQANHIHTLYIVAEGTPGGIQATPTRFNFTTLPCPKIDILTGFTQPVQCVNKGAIALFKVTIDDPPTSGILNGTTWFMDWGDGNTTNYTSTADYDVPSVALRTHTYTSVTDCNYIFTNTVRNPCGETRSVQYIAVVHGRDIPSDGDGVLQLVDNANGSTTIQVCAGTQTTVTIRDNSTWNCQNPVLPGGFTAVPNTDPRNIEWLYGRDPLGAITNTINGTVSVATLGNAPQTSNRISPSPYGPGSLSQAITIPASCQAGQYFRVYMKEWNKCNWTDPEYVNTFVDINVIAAPPAPAVLSRTICFGDDRTLTVTSPPVGTITWYSDAALTTPVATGTSYVPTNPAVGTYNFWVTDQSLTGLMCMSPSTPVTLTILPVISNNTIAAPQTICYNSAPSGLTGSAPAGGNGTYAYQWQSSPDNSTWTNIGGATSQNYGPGALTTSTYFRRVVTSGPCSLASSSILITVYAQLTAGSIGSVQSICYNTTPSALTQSAPPSGGTGTYTYQWQSSPDNSTWTSIVGATGTGYAPPSLTSSTYYRRQVTSGSCGTVSTTSILITVYPDLTPGSVGNAQTICYNTAPAGLSQITAPTGGNGTYAYQWQRSPDNATWSNIGSATGSNYSPPALTSTTYFRRRVTSSTCTQVYSASVLITVYGQLTSGTIGTAQSICYNTAPAALTEVTAPAGGTGTYTYQWQSSPDNSTWTSIVGATAVGYAPPVLTSNTYYRRRVTSGTCGTVSSTSILITVYTQLTSGTIGSAQSICYNTAPAALSQSTAPTGGTGVYTYQWQSSPDNSTWTSIVGATGSGYSPSALTANTYFRRQVTSGTCGTASTTSILIIVYPNLTPGSVGSAQTICYNTAPAGLTQITAPGGGNGTYSYQWQSSPDNITWSNIVGATASTYNPSALTAATYFRRNVTSSTCTAVSSASVLISLYPTLTQAQLHDNISICNNTSTNFNVALTGGTSPFSINYTRNGVPQAAIPGYVSGTNISTGNLTTGSYVYALTSVADAHGCLAQNLGTSITVTVGSSMTNATFTGNGPLCFNTAGTLTSVITGGAPFYTLTITGYSGSPVSGYTSGANINLGVQAPGTYNYTLTSIVDACGNSLASGLPKNYSLIVYDNLTAGTIGTAQSICYNTVPAGLAQLTAPTGGPGGYTYQWQSSPDNSTWSSIGGATGTGYSPTALTTSTYYRRQVTSGTCGTVNSNSVLITVYGNLTAGSIGTAQSICYNTIPSALTEVTAPSGGPGGYTYQWQSSPDNSTWSNIVGATVSGYAPSALTASTYYRRQVTSGTCGTVSSTSILITVYGSLTPGSIGTIQSICYNTVPSALTEATAPTGGTGSYTYQWQRSPDNSTWSNIGGATASGYAPAALSTSTYYRRLVTSGTCGTVNSTSILITVYGNLVPGSIGTAQSICYNTVPSALSEVTAPTGGPGGYAYQWQSSPDNLTWSDISGANASGYAPPALTASTYYRRRVTSGSCGTVSSNAILITVYGNLTPGSIGSAQSICYNTVPSALTQVTAPSGGPGGYTYQWQSSPDNSTWSDISSATASGYAPPALSASTYYRRNVTSGTCGTLSSNVILVTVYGNLTPGSIGTAQSICYNTVPAALSEVTAPSGGTGGYTYQWQSSPDNSTWSNIVGATASGYAPSALTAGTYYRRRVTSGTCGTVNSTSILITVYGNLTPGSIGTSQSICYNTIPSALTEVTAPTGGPGSYTYQWQSSPDNITWSIIGGANAAGYAPAALTTSTYYRRQVTSGTCGTVNSNAILITVYGNLTPGSVGSPQTICQYTAPAGLTQLSAPTGGTGTYAYQWQSSPDNSTWFNIGGATSSTYNPGSLSVTTYFRRQVTSGLCGTVPSGSVLITVTPLPVVSVQSLTVCSGEVMNYTILLNNYANPADNVTFTWPAPTLTANVSGGTARSSASSSNITDVFTNTSGSMGTATYVVTANKNGCPGTPVNIVVTVNSQPVLDPGLSRFTCSSTVTGLVLKEASGSVAPSYYNIISISIDPGLTAAPGNAVIPDATAPAVYLSADVFTNVTGVNKNVTYRIQPILAPSCFGDPVDVVVTIRPQPVILPGQTKPVCSRVPIGKEILLVPANTPAGTLFNWGMPAMSDGSGQGTAGVNIAADPAGTTHINDAIHNYSSAPITATYSVTPTSQFGCAGNATPVVITINQEPLPQTISGRTNLCAGEKNVVYIVNPVGGSTFHWTVAPAVGIKTFDFNTNAILINAALSSGSGNITVYETNSLGCSGDLSTLPVSVYTAPPAENISGDAVVCALSTHVYSVTNRAGSVFNWTIPGGAGIIGDPSASSVTVLFGITGGTILVRETNIAGCVTNHNPLSVTVQPLPTAIISNGGTMCDGGTRPLNVAFNGTPPFNFTYAINGVPQLPVSTSSNPYTITAVLQGTYTIVNVSDNTGCTNTGSGTAVVTYFPKPTGIISGTSEICRGSSTTITMTITGVAPYTFTYTDGTTPVTVTSHPTNVYTATVSPAANTTYTITSLTDYNNCAGALSGSAVITVNQTPLLSLTGTNLICFNVNTGAVDLTISSGTSPFGISWTGPDGFTAPTEDISGLKAGYYAVTVIDTKGCTATGNITLTQPPQLNAALSGTNVTCFGANDGTITISAATGGTGNYEYTVNGGTLWVASGSFTNLAPGTYNVRMRDAVNPTCILTLNNSLVLTGPAVLNATITKTDITCFGSHNGSIVISSPTGGYGTYQYSINGGTSWIGSGSFTNLTAGTYNVRIRDAVNTTCVIILDPAVVISEPPVLAATVTSTNISCFGSSDGSITIASPSGGHGTYEYSINGGGSWQGSGSYASLVPGNYNVQIRDASVPSCYIILNNSLALTQPAVLTANISSANVTCYGANDGTIAITAPSGGSGNYEYTINGGTSWFPSGTFTGLASDTYNVRIRDASHTGCSITLNAGLQITEPDKLSAMVVDTDVSCFGASDGAITITNSAGGYGTYQYTIDGGTTWQNSPSFSPLATGTYDVRMRDRAHTACVLILDMAVQITAPAVLNASVTSSNVTCYSANDGSITISSPTGGYGSYSYSVNGGSSWQGSGTFTNLSPGTYNVRMRDALHTPCSIILNPALLITEPATLTATVSATNITCNGAADGTISITSAAGGYGMYEYTVNGGGTWQSSGTFTLLNPGFYNVRIRDAAQPLCVITLNPSLRITEPNLLTASVARTNVSCNGANDGTITITSPTGGYGTYNYSINGGTSWQASGSFTGLAPATYNVLIRDAAHQACIITLNGALVITEPAVLSASITPVMVSCFGAGDGIISIINPTGGYGTYEYSINGGSTWVGSSTFSGLAPATYNVRIRDAAHTTCTVILNPALVITQPTALNAVIARTNITCNGGSDGTITITNPTGGYGTYEYTINGGGSWLSSGTFAGLGPGTYNVQVRDAAHTTCVTVLNNAYVITQPAILKANISSTPATCNGAADGTITVSGATGGYGTYEFSVNGGTSWQSSGSFTGLTPSTYDIRIRDVAHIACEVTLNPGLTISEPALLNALVASTDVTCNGANDGTISISSPTGGYGTYEFSVNGGTNWQMSGLFTSLSPASYNIRIRDRAHTGCVIVLNTALLINQPPVLSASVSSTNVTCNGAGDGSIAISGAVGGYGTYQYSISGGVSWQSSGTFTGVVPGSYNVRIRDGAHVTCEIVLNPALQITQPAKLAATVTHSNVTCFGSNDGTISINSPTGGYGSYEYSTDGGTTWQPGGSFSSLAPGIYNVQIRDAAHIGCVVILNGSLMITEPPALTATLGSSNVTCFGSGDGRITITSPAGGYGTYEYSTNGGTNWQASGTFTGLTPATYNVRIRDAAHITCVTILNPALVITQPAVLTAIATSTDVTCNSQNDGTITISGASGGYGTYQYSVNGGTSWFGSGLFTSLVPGSYNVRMRDAANPTCFVIINPSLVLTEPAALNATLSTANITCFGSSNGSITISGATGGYGTYEYTINGGGSWQTSGSFTGLGPGNYNVQMRDAGHTGCIKVLNSSLTLSQPAALNAVVGPSMVTCNGTNDGIISITSPTGGSGTYEYSVNGGTIWSGSGSFTGLAPATYNVWIRDAVNQTCVIILNNNLLITEPSALNAILNSTSITCNGATDGTISISFPTGGYGTYEYSINGGASWQLTGNYTGLAPAIYIVEIRDKAHNGCVKILDPALTLTQPDVLSATVVSANVSCNGANDGSITVTNPAGGYGTYGYSINGGSSWQSSGIFTNLAPATFDVRIRDAAHISCVAILNPSVTITQPAVLNAALASTNVSCYGSTDGTITISSPTGGGGTYEYSVNGGAGWQGSGSFISLTPGFYNVQIRDAAHPACVRTLNASLRITEPPVMAAFVMKTDATCAGTDDGTISINGATGGYGTYEYSISGGTSWQSTGSFTSLAPGTYDVRIRDAAHITCVIVLNPSMTINQPTALNAIVAPTMISCFGANDGIIAVTNPVGGSGFYMYSINGGTTWQGTGTFYNLAPGNYNVRIRDAVNISCVITLNPAVAITQPPVLSATISSTNVTCFAGNDGTITISAATGGYGTYQYSINGGGSWQASGSFTGLTPGSYSVLLRDAAHTGCIVVLNSAYIITQPAMLSATVNKTEVTCHGNSDGTISITSPAGGYGTYEYSANGGTSWQASGNFTNLAPGTYNVRMRDAAHTTCSTILYPNLIITEPLTLAMSSTGDVVLDCNGDLDGSGTFYATGGTLPYTFVIVSNTTGGTVSAPGFNSQSFFNAGVGSITVMVVDLNGCSAQSVINITQPPALTPGSIAANQVVCSGDNPAMLTELSAPAGGPAAYAFQWQYSPNISGPFVNVSGATIATYTPPAGATYTIYYRRMVTSGVCLPVYSNIVEVRVNPVPIALLSGGETICPGQSSILHVNLPAGTGPFTIDIQNLGTVNNYVSGSDIVVTPGTTTTYTITRVRDANNCQVVSPSPNISGSATITVNALPSITSFTPSPAVCEYALAAFRVVVSGSNLTYQWYVNEGSGFIPVTDGSTYFGTLTPTLQIFNSVRTMNGYIYHAVVSGCGNNVTTPDAVLTVNTPPEIITQPRDTTICNGQNASIEANASGTSITWQWYVNKGAGFVQVTDDANFSGSATRILTITNASSSYNNWVFRAVVTGICGVPVGTSFAVLRVINPPVVSLQPLSRTVCENSTTSFFGNGSGYNSLQWQVFSGGIWTGLNDDVVYIGTHSQMLSIMNATDVMNGYQFRLALNGNCATTFSNPATLTVNPNPVVGISALSPIKACGGVPVVLNGNPLDGSGSYLQHRWTGDVGPLSSYTVQSPTFNSFIAASYNLNYKVTDSNGCSGSGDVTVNVDSPNAQFTQDIENGCTPLPVAFTKDTTGIAKWWWSYGDGSPVDSVTVNPVHTFTNTLSGSIEYYNINLKVQSPGGCTEQYSTTLTVFPEVDASFTPDKLVVCSGKAITFTATTGAGRYFWDYGDGANGYGAYIASHLYTNFTTAPIVHTVTLTTTSFYNCTSVKSVDITVMPVPQPQFTADPITQTYNPAGNPVTFTNGTNPGTWNWLWRFGDNASSNDVNPVHNYNDVGTYPVTLIVSNSSCTDSIMHDVYVTPLPPVARFDSVPSGCSPLNVIFNNTSLNTEIPGTAYYWSFGDGGTSTAKNPVYIYLTPGTFKIELTVTGPGGTSTYSRVVGVFPSPKAYFEVSPPKVLANDENVRCFNLSQGAASYVWDFGDGDTSKVYEPFHRYIEEGVYDITLWAYSINGCSDKYVLSPAVTVEPVGDLRYPTVFIPNKTGPIDRTDLPTSGIEADQFFYPPIRQEVTKYHLQIFNRWGVLIFESHEVNRPWNGYYKGELCEQGVYVWYVEGKYADGRPFKKVGDITLLH